MATKTLIAQTGVVGAGSIVGFPGSDDVRTVQFNPAANQGFSGTVVVEGTYASSPGANDFVVLATVTFTGHTNNLSLDIDSDVPSVRARITASQGGAIAVFATSRFGSIGGSQGSGTASATVDSPLRVAGTGNNFTINSPVVPSITSDDVIYAGNFNQTVTDLLDGTSGAAGFQSKIGTGMITADEGDVNVLTGVDSYGLTTADMQKLADVNASANELNYSIGLTSNVQSQIDAISGDVNADLADLNTTAATIDAFFDVAPVVTIGDLNAFSGLTADAADLNVFSGSAGSFTAADMTKLGNITATDAEINVLSGMLSSTAELNRLAGIVSTTADINAISGLAGTTVTATELGHLSGLTQNVQSALNTLPSLVGLTATANDLNTLSGIFTGTGPYSGQVSATELSYLDGVNSNIQAQLNSKRNTSTPIGINEISGASITLTELNYLSGATANIQSQIDAIGVASIGPSGGTFTGPVYISSGSAAAPGLGYAGANTTGFYLYGPNGIGLSIGGTRSVTIDGTNVRVGPGTNPTEPQIRGSAPSVTNPAYSFAGDDNTGMYWAGTDSIGFAGGGSNLMTLDGDSGQVTVGGAVADNNEVTISGIFGGEKLLGVGQVNAGSGSATGQTALYEVPTGRTALITRIYFVVNTIAGSPTNDFNINVGFGGAFDEIVDNTNNPTIFNPAGYNFDTPNQIMPLGVGDNTFPAISGSSGADYQAMTSGAVLEADVTALDSTATNFTMDVYVMGVEY